MNVALSCQRAFLGRHARAPSVAIAAIAETAASEYADVAVKNSGWLASFDIVITVVSYQKPQYSKNKKVVAVVVAVGDTEARCSASIHRLEKQ